MTYIAQMPLFEALMEGRFRPDMDVVHNEEKNVWRISWTDTAGREIAAEDVRRDSAIQAFQAQLYEDVKDNKVTGW